MEASPQWSERGGPETFTCAARSWQAHEGKCRSYLRRRLADADAAIPRTCDPQGQTRRAFAQANGLSLPAAKARLLGARLRLRDRMTSACQVRFGADGRVGGRVGGHVPRPAAG